MNKNPFAAIILAAGEGTRMRSARPKVLHELAGRPMIRHLIEALRPLAPTETVVVLGRGMEAVARAVAPAKAVIQDPPRGTGDAVRAALEALPLGSIRDVLVLYGDTPLLRRERLEELLAVRRRVPEAAVAAAGMRPGDPGPYGRLVLSAGGMLERIVEAKDADNEERAIGLCNGGIMAIDAGHLADLIGRIGNDNAKREFYLTDIVALARAEGLVCRAAELPADELIGVNTRAELAAAEALLQQRLREQAMAEGATLIAPETVFFSADTKLGRDVVVEPHVFFGPGVTVADNARICAFSYMTEATIGEGARVGPFARLRPGAVLDEDVHVGNFVEIKASRLHAGVKASHLTYLGDTEVGARTNIGAGTITCNYDGYNKHRTTIGENVFVGTHTSLVAPVSVGDGAYVATGSVITSDVPADALTIARSRQVDKPGRAVELRQRLRERKR
ncbi:MAG TPA: bifunctional UDP-N-acetylglucosamine diphosphorylase/glucosamine-1-phosphate N-acetyltransferase GlmU [Stellaceae bacterium]|jgi:bifunctional UDP-N-acetylglucosamine pyrophosphorylase/glucosamine-1-phosphate N-acetyltransferase|nr:bifunctional UDP-N-acetylglucosamine diphosphorylase/glucosamine-1-phosphate N-acetyltransferase GlmU [Stellaceae bacterium]